jgi:hypothetical protein
MNERANDSDLLYRPVSVTVAAAIARFVPPA